MAESPAPAPDLVEARPSQRPQDRVTLQYYDARENFRFLEATAPTLDRRLRTALDEYENPRLVIGYVYGGRKLFVVGICEAGKYVTDRTSQHRTYYDARTVYIWGEKIVNGEEVKDLRINRDDPDYQPVLDEMKELEVVFVYNPLEL